MSEDTGTRPRKPLHIHLVKRLRGASRQRPPKLHPLVDPRQVPRGDDPPPRAA